MTDEKDKYEEIQFIIDSGTTSHVCKEIRFFENYEEGLIKIGLAKTNDSMTATGRGEILVENHNNFPIRIKKVLHVPETEYNLLSVAKMLDNGLTVTFKEDTVVVKDPQGMVMFVAHRDGDKFIVNFRLKKKTEEVCMANANNARWHMRLSHVNFNTLKQMEKDNMVVGMNLQREEKNMCQACIMGKMKKLPHKRQKERRATSILELLHMDLIGPITPKTNGGASYILTIVDDYSRMITVKLLKKKSDAAKLIEETIKTMENQTTHKVKYVRSDNGGEFIKDDLEEYFQRKGIKHELTVPYTPQSNGIAERANRTIIETTRTMMHDSGLPMCFWGECARTAVYGLNRCKNSTTGKTPYELWNDRLPNVGFMKRFGCTAYSLIKGRRRNKFASKANIGIFVGYPENRIGYRIYDPKEDIVYEERDVKFDENELGVKYMKKQTETEELVLEDLEDINDDVSFLKDDKKEKQDEYESTNTEEEMEEEGERQVGQKMGEPQISDGESFRGRPSGITKEIKEVRDKEERKRNEQQFQEKGVRRSERIREKQAALKVEEITIPKTYEDALQVPEKEEWLRAMKEEIESMNKHGVWKLSTLPKGSKAIKAKWVFGIKTGQKGENKKFKARLVAVGCSQRPGIDYEDTFAPVVRVETIRYLFNLAAKKGVKIKSHDVKSAFLHGNLNEKIYMVQPKGFETGVTEQVCELQKSIYGLKQAGRCWNELLHEILLECGFKQSSQDQCLYYIQEENNFLYIGVHVDDMISLASREKFENDCLKEVKNRIDLITIGEASMVLGVELEQKDGEIKVHQKKYIKDILEQYKMSDCNPVKSPVDVNQNLDNYEDSNDVDATKYQELIGKLMYLAVHTRPDISFALGSLSQYNKNPKEIHYNALKRVLRYLKGTQDYTMIYKQDDSRLEGYTDASWDRTKDAKSFSGFIIKDNESLIHWKCKKQDVVAMSTTESELNALAEGVKELKWTKDLMCELGNNQENVDLFCDNLNVVSLIKGGNQKSRTKYLNRKMIFVKEEVKSNCISVKHIPGKEMIADVMTKGLNGPEMKANVSKLLCVE